MTTPDHIIALARKAGFAYDSRTGRIFASHGGFNWVINEELQRFAALIQEEAMQKEREACIAKIQAEIDHSYLNNHRLIPSFGKRQGDIAVRAGSLEAVLDSIRDGLHYSRD